MDDAAQTAAIHPLLPPSAHQPPKSGSRQVVHARQILVRVGKRILELGEIFRRRGTLPLFHPPENAHAPGLASVHCGV